jgi:hypothetical protein
LSRIFHDLMEARLIDMAGKRILIHSIQRLRDAIIHDSPDGSLLATISARPRAGKRPQHASPMQLGETRRHAGHAEPIDLALEHRVTASW